jgi:hypothetical protein
MKMNLDLNASRSLEENLTLIRSRLGSCLNQVEMLTVAAPFCAPMLELVRDELREALLATEDAEELERKIVRALTGPIPRSYPRPVLLKGDGDQQ